MLVFPLAVAVSILVPPRSQYESLTMPLANRLSSCEVHAAAITAVAASPTVETTSFSADWAPWCLVRLACNGKAIMIVELEFAKHLQRGPSGGDAKSAVARGRAPAAAPPS